LRNPTVTVVARIATALSLPIGQPLDELAAPNRLLRVIPTARVTCAATQA
jgi:hypothetical protein